MATFSWFRIEAGTWLASLAVRRLTPIERAALVDLRALQVVNGPLPDDAAELADHLRYPLEAVTRVLIEFFELVDGRRVDHELEVTRDRVTEISAKRAAAGRLGGRRSSYGRALKTSAGASSQANAGANGQAFAKQVPAYKKRKREREEQRESVRGREGAGAVAVQEAAPAPLSLTLREVASRVGLEPPASPNGPQAKAGPGPDWADGSTSGELQA